MPFPSRCGITNQCHVAQLKIKSFLCIYMSYTDTKIGKIDNNSHPVDPVTKKKECKHNDKAQRIYCYIVHAMPFCSVRDRFAAHIHRIRIYIYRQSCIDRHACLCTYNSRQLSTVKRLPPYRFHVYRGCAVAAMGRHTSINNHINSNNNAYIVAPNNPPMLYIVHILVI